MTKKRDHGSSLESLLAEDGILEEAEVEATKKVIAAQIAPTMKEKASPKRPWPK